MIQLGANSGVIVEPPLPLELRQAVQRYPVTLYAMRVCEPCDSARTLLRQRRCQERKGQKHRSRDS